MNVTFMVQIERAIEIRKTAIMSMRYLGMTFFNSVESSFGGVDKKQTDNSTENVDNLQS